MDVNYLGKHEASVATLGELVKVGEIVGRKCNGAPSVSVTLETTTHIIVHDVWMPFDYSV